MMMLVLEEKPRSWWWWNGSWPELQWRWLEAEPVEELPRVLTGSQALPPRLEKRVVLLRPEEEKEEGMALMSGLQWSDRASPSASQCGLHWGVPQQPSARQVLAGTRLLPECRETWP